MIESEMVSRQLSFHLSALNLFCFFYLKMKEKEKKCFVDVYIGVWSFIERYSLLKSYTTSPSNKRTTSIVIMERQSVQH